MQILYNGRIQTLDPAQPLASAMAIDGGRIMAVGSDEEVLVLANWRSSQFDLNGKTVWPGLTDAHIHLDHYSQGLSFVDCETSTRDECLQRVAAKARQVSPGEWIRGHGWNQNSWPEGFGKSSDLDEITTNHPVYLTAKSLHAAWANSTAMQLAGITPSTPDPDGGKILRDSSGKPTGILLESAMSLVESAVLPVTVEKVRENILAAQRTLWQLGITGVHDFDQARCFTALQMLDSEQKLHLRVVKSIPYDLLPHAAALGLRSGFGSQFLRIGAVKMFSDGALGPRTAAMLQPYEGEPENTGILLLDSEQILEAGQQAAQTGLSLAIHAIGDRANHEVLNAYAQLRQFETDSHFPHLRHRIEHVQILHPQDYDRLAALQVIASVQPIHATSDMYMADRFWGKRSAGAYAYGTLNKLGTSLAFGSDAPVEQPNPFLGLHAAVTRQRPDGQPQGEGWYPDQRLTFMQALQGFTTGPAFASYQEDFLGRISPGYLADIIILAVDPFEIPPEEICQIQPAATIVAGDWVWQTE